MRIVILGADLLGIRTVSELSEGNKDVVVIERNPDIARAIANELDCSVLEGDGENVDFLTEAGLEDADWFIALTGRDEANIVAWGIVSENFKKTTDDSPRLQRSVFRSPQTEQTISGSRPHSQSRCSHRKINRSFCP
ncbi:MAG: NAD-binding protein [Rectinemataceae bacterium]|nr:NAD-binding protein [Rectinemataceae bacterium]